jgi:hypothetical protein
MKKAKMKRETPAMCRGLEAVLLYDGAAMDASI